MGRQRVEAGGDDLKCHRDKDIEEGGLIHQCRARKSELSGSRDQYGLRTRSLGLCPIRRAHLAAGSLEEKQTSRQAVLSGSGVLEGNNAVDVLWSWY